MAEMILLFLSMVTLLSFPTAEAVYLYHFCPNTTVFTPNSTFQSNRNHLLSTLSSNSTRSTGFYNATAGRSPAETIYGLFLCRGDVTSANCKACVATATSEVVQRCPFEKEVVIWYDDCMLRYSNESFFSVADDSPAVFLSNTGNVSSEPNRFNQVLGESMTEVATEASNDDDRFATREANFTDVISVYSLGQCTQDLSSFDCNRCLRGAIAYLPTCCGGKIGGRVLNPSCTVRFEQYPFYQKNLSAPALPPKSSPRPPLPPSTVTKEIVIIENQTEIEGQIEAPKFHQALSSTMDGLLQKVIDAPDKFATNDANVTASSTLYTLGQCTQNLTKSDCSSCLTEVIGYIQTCCTNKTGASVQSPSCNVSFQLHPFYALNIPPSPAPIAHTPPTPVGASPPALKVAKNSKLLSIVIASILAPVALCVLVVVVVVVRCFISKLKRAKRQRNKAEFDMTSVESLRFDLGTIEAATKKFSSHNKLGEGGFGQVFKGTLNNGQEIAVKRLSKSSGQGVREFQNEVLLVAKLQHRNLVRLLGFCLEGEETVLVYEYVPNKSLDYFLFDAEKRELLDWPRRCTIIGGIARGILYLHEDSRLRVIHRDLKASNILLDANLHPKISDFGIARMFGLDDQTQGNTRRIVGTYGYMAPEYAMEGLYSIKSDVFSFGILLLEILTGRKNFSGFHPTTSTPTLLSQAWQLWNEGEVLELMDPLLKDACNPTEFLRYIHIGLLCVQEKANDRPTMSSVLLMLKSESISLTKPERPAFITGGSSNDHGHTLGDLPGFSVNGLTVSDDIPR